MGHRRDDNEKDIIKALRGVGATVCRLDAAADVAGVVDLLVGFRGTTHLVEVKRALGPRGGSSRSKLTQKQRDWHAAWKGGPVRVVRTVDEALAAIGVTILPVRFNPNAKCEVTR